VLRQFEQQHYNDHRPHRALGQAAPLRAVPRHAPTAVDNIRRRDRLGGLIHIGSAEYVAPTRLPSPGAWPWLDWFGELSSWPVAHPPSSTALSTVTRRFALNSDIGLLSRVDRRPLFVVPPGRSARSSSGPAAVDSLGGRGA
jgi:hypothetical protein